MKTFVQLKPPNSAHYLEQNAIDEKTKSELLLEYVLNLDIISDAVYEQE